MSQKSSCGPQRELLFVQQELLFVACVLLSSECLPDPREVVIAVPDGVIFQKELTRQRRVSVERHRRRLRELRIAEGADRGRRRCGVARQKLERRFFRDTLGAGFIDYYVHIKNAEIERFQAEVSDWEHREYFGIF